MPQSVNRQEIQQLLTDPGYSADDREDRLKEALTILSSQDADAEHPDPDRSKLISDLQREIDRQAVEPDERPRRR